MARVLPLLLGTKGGDSRRRVVGLSLGLFALTFLAYELDLFFTSGGVVFVPFHAAIVGAIAAFWTGFNRSGLLSGWALAYSSFLGWHAEWATEISTRPLIERLAYVVRPDGLVALAVIAVGVAVTGFFAGELARRGFNAFRTGPRETTDT